MVEKYRSELLSGSFGKTDPPDEQVIPKRYPKSRGTASADKRGDTIFLLHNFFKIVFLGSVKYRIYGELRDVISNLMVIALLRESSNK